MAFIFTQSKSAGGSSTSPSITFNATPTYGSVLVCGIFSASNTAITMSSAGWTALTSVSAGTGGSQVAFRMFWKQAIDGESVTVTGISGGPNAWAMVGAEYSVSGLGFKLDKESALNNAAGTSQPTPSVNPVNGSEILSVCVSAVRGASANFSTQTIRGSNGGVTEREDVGQATNTANSCLYDLFLNTSVSGVVGTSVSTVSAVGAGGVAVFSLLAPSNENLRHVKAGNNISVSERIR